MEESLAEAAARIPFLKAFGPTERERLLRRARLKTLGPREACWVEGQAPDDFAFVVRGRLKLVKSAESGRETILEMVVAGELLCGSAVFCHVPHCCASLAQEGGTQVLLLPRADVLEAVERYPAAARALLQELTTRGVAMCRRVEELAAGQVEQRIALLLIKLADRSGIARSGTATQVPVRLTRQDLADLCGTTVETAIRVMSRLTKEKLIETASRGFLIRDRRALEAVARGRRRSGAATGRS